MRTLSVGTSYHIRTWEHSPAPPLIMKVKMSEPFINNEFFNELKKRKRSNVMEQNPNWIVPESMATNMGWKCPVCGKGNAPLVLSCPCTPVNESITDGDTKQLLTED